jgi:hypothetical protein
VIIVVNPRWRRWVGYVASMGAVISVYKISVGKCEKTQLGECISRQKNNIDPINIVVTATCCNNTKNSRGDYFPKQ